MRVAPVNGHAIQSMRLDCPALTEKRSWTATSSTEYQKRNNHIMRHKIIIKSVLFIIKIK